MPEHESIPGQAAASGGVTHHRRNFGKGHHTNSSTLNIPNLPFPPTSPKPPYRTYPSTTPNLQCHQGLVDLSKVPVLLRRHLPRLVVPLRPGQVHETEAATTFQLKDTDRLRKRCVFFGGGRSEEEKILGGKMHFFFQVTKWKWNELVFKSSATSLFPLSNFALSRSHLETKQHPSLSASLKSQLDLC